MATNSLDTLKIIDKAGQEHEFISGLRVVHGKITKSNVTTIDETITLDEGWKFIKYFFRVYGKGDFVYSEDAVHLKCKTGGIVKNHESSDSINSVFFSGTNVRDISIKDVLFNYDATNLSLKKEYGNPHVTVNELIFEYWVYY